MKLFFRQKSKNDQCETKLRSTRRTRLRRLKMPRCPYPPYMRATTERPCAVGEPEDHGGEGDGGGRGGDGPPRQGGGAVHHQGGADGDAQRPRRHGGPDQGGSAAGTHHPGLIFWGLEDRSTAQLTTTFSPHRSANWFGCGLTVPKIDVLDDGLLPGF